MKTPCYVFCNCNVANINVAAIYLSERLNSNLYFTLEKSIFSLVYISFCPPFFCQSEEKFVKCSHEREEGKFSDSQIFLFYKIYKSSQRMLLAFGFLLLSYELYKIVRISVIYLLFTKSSLKVCNDQATTARSCCLGYFSANFELTRVHYCYIFWSGSLNAKNLPKVNGREIMMASPSAALRSFL